MIESLLSGVLLFLLAVWVGWTVSGGSRSSRRSELPLEVQFELSRLEQERWDERAADNEQRYRECQAKEAAAYEKQRWEMLWLEAWWDLFRNVHGIQCKSMYGYPMRFKTCRAVLLSGDKYEFYWPDLPKPLPRPQAMWALWECVYVLKRPAAEVARLTEMLTS